MGRHSPAIALLTAPAPHPQGCAGTMAAATPRLRKDRAASVRLTNVCALSMADRAAIRDYAREETLVETDDWGNDKINTLINRANHIVSTRFLWPFLATSSNISTTAGTQSYAMPTDLARFEALVEADTTRRLREIPASVAWAQYGGDFPDGDDATHFFVWGSDIYLIPIPETTETNEYTLYYYKQPDSLDNDTDAPEFATEFHYVLADYVISRIWKREEDFERAEDAMEDFNRGVEEMARYYLNRGKDQPLVMGGGESNRTRHDITTHMPWLNGA